MVYIQKNQKQIGGYFCIMVHIQKAGKTGGGGGGGGGGGVFLHCFLNGSYTKIRKMGGGVIFAYIYSF